MKSMEVRELSREEYERALEGLTATPPIEQCAVWQDLQDTVEGRSHWAYLALERHGQTCAVVALVDYLTHGYHYLRGTHGPVWAEKPSAFDEGEALRDLVRYVRRRDRKVVFLRMAVAHELAETRPVLSTSPYDATVVIDLTGGDDAILSRMKPRGRRDVRKAWRECEAVFADETERASASFDEYYEVMEVTAARDGFAAAPKEDYVGMIRTLGPERCRVYASRMDDKVVTWSIVTISGRRATRYYGASNRLGQRSHATDRLVMDECQALAQRGCEVYDLMGIGTEFSPSLMGLNDFKTKFSKEVVPVAPDRDVPVQGLAYAALSRVRDLRDARAERAQRRLEERTPDEPRDDILPVILGGDIGVYALGREFHEAYGVRSVCVVPAPIKAIELSAIFDVRHEDVDADAVCRIVDELARQYPGKKIVVTANTDAYVKVLEECSGRFPQGVYCPLPPRELVQRVSDKVEFARICAEYGLDAPATEVVHLAGDDDIPPTGMAFPLVAKPADSAAYFHMHYQGFRKAYCVGSQEELDGLWRDLRAAGFAGDFLVQEMIEGDDTAMDCVTVYVDVSGKPTMFASMQILLQDHAPTMIGNYVAMMSRPRPELWDKVGAMLKGIGYRGFANFDIKHDRRTGRTVFLDFNPRMGRASYSVCAAGVNPMRVMVSDVVDGRSGRVLKATEPALYTLVSPSLLMRYLRDPGLRREVRELMDAGRAVDPQVYWPERDPRRAAYVLLTRKNHQRKFAENYPEASDTSF